MTSNRRQPIQLSRITITLSLLLLFFAGLGACRTVPTDVPEDLTAPQLFQEAQSAVDNDNFPAALVYYETALERFEDDPEVRTIALYEIGFIHYRRGRDDEARPYFERVLEQYENGEQAVPQWPRLLSERFLEEMNRRES